MPTVRKCNELSDSAGEDEEEGGSHQSDHEDSVFDPEQLKKEWKKRLGDGMCSCAKKRKSKTRVDTCLTYFQEIGFNGLMQFHTRWQKLHKLDQDKLVSWTEFKCVQLSFNSQAGQ